MGNSLLAVRGINHKYIVVDEEEEEIDVCKAVDQMTERARQEGLRAGRLKNLQDNVKTIMESLNMSMDDAMNALKVTGEDRILLQEMV